MTFRLALAVVPPTAPAVRPPFQWLAASLGAHVGLAALILAAASFTRPVVPAADVVSVEIITRAADPPEEEALPAVAPSETGVEDVPVPELPAPPGEVAMADVPPPAPQEVFPSEAPAPLRPAPAPRAKPRATPRPALVPTPVAVERARPASDAQQSVTPSSDEGSTRVSTPASAPEIPPDGRQNDYVVRVWKWIARYKPRSTRWAGAAEVTFTVSAEGALVDVRISASSGNERLDAIALDVVVRAAPLPPPPPHGGMTFSIPFHFQ